MKGNCTKETKRGNGDIEVQSRGRSANSPAEMQAFLIGFSDARSRNEARRVKAGESEPRNDMIGGNKRSPKTEKSASNSKENSCPHDTSRSEESPRMLV